jgi:hypothetical protein
MTVDQRITNSANGARSINFHGVTTSGWIMEELSESEVDKKNLVGQLANIQCKIVRFDVEVNIVLIVQ